MGGNSAELERNGRKNDHRDAKFTVLAESVRHHIKEEESEMLKMVFRQMPTPWLRRRIGKGDSPAAAAKRRKCAQGTEGPCDIFLRPCTEEHFQASH